MDTVPPAQKLHQLTSHCRKEESTCWSTQGISSSLPQSGRATCLNADFKSAAVPSPSFWSSSYFLWLCSRILLTKKTNNPTMGLASQHWMLLTSLQANIPFSLHYQLFAQATLPQSSPPPLTPSSKLALYFLCQAPPKSFTNSSEFLASCAIQFTWMFPLIFKNKNKKQKQKQVVST